MPFFVLKLLRFLVVVWVVITLNFLIPRLMPGDPVILMLGEEAIALAREDYIELKRRYGLDQPLGAQYAGYLAGVAGGDLGYSLHHGRSVADLIWSRIGGTVRLMLSAILLSTALAVLLGTFAGWRAGSRWDLWMTTGALAIYALPQFVLAMMVLAVFGFHWPLFPLGGLSSGPVTGGTAALVDQVRHLFLPVLVLALATLPAKYLLVRNEVSAARLEGYVVYALAKGLSRRRILFRHVLPNACLPLLSLVALNLGFMVSGALLVEIVFSINGMGFLIYDAAVSRDYPVLQGCFLVLTLMVVAANMLVDVVYGLLDPRVRA